MDGDWTLLRTRKRPDGIISTLLDEQQLPVAVTIEHSYDGQPKLQPGRYLCQRGLHQLAHGAPVETFEITGVPGHTGILFHIGNYHADSDGCVCLGRVGMDSPEGYLVTASAETFAAFMLELEGTDAFWLRVIE